MLAGNEDCSSWMKVPVDTSGRRVSEFACPVPVHTGATTFGTDVVLGLRKKMGEGHLLLYLDKKLHINMLADDTPEPKCFVNRWVPQQSPRYSDNHSRLVLTRDHSLGWHSSVAGGNSFLFRRNPGLPQCISPQGQPVAEVGCVRRKIAVPSNATTFGEV
ncbi:unnamed protein product [Staurois parvus]|uniref:Uncharacterized protein n=1 Tax=Staurois parvus TaxID=386267 RepID=A0ABN9G319_9NEOB|nr:unnamed protein product [Staurois parvus]